MDEVGGTAVREKRLGFESAAEGRGREQRRWNDGDGSRIFRDRDDARVAEQREAVRERANVIQAVAGKVAVVDEEDVHAEQIDRSDEEPLMDTNTR